MQKFISLGVTCPSDTSEFLMAELANTGFDSFLETEVGFEACITFDLFDETLTLEILKKYKLESKDFIIKDLAQQNWNALWESSFEHVIINEKLKIRAPFHLADPNFTLELVIQPKTSFGTGHHETTASILSLMLSIDFNGKKVFDYGSGTGILAILAKKLGAETIVANDIDDWAAENINENIGLNQVSDITFIHGDLSKVSDNDFDVILANINRNVLQASMSDMAALLNKNGQIIISGFYESDLIILKDSILAAGLLVQTYQTKNNWCAAILTFS
jgi:ribosomal protein L11 methyltransferase